MVSIKYVSNRLELRGLPQITASGDHMRSSAATPPIRVTRPLASPRTDGPRGKMRWSEGVVVRLAGVSRTLY